MISLNEFKKLLLDNNYEKLGMLAKKARIITEKYFGKTIELYIPLYISNFCYNNCTYCNFSIKNTNLKRQRLTLKEIETELKVIKSKGFDEVLILTGDDKRDFQLVVDSVTIARRYFSKIGVEIFACSTDEYKILKDAGVSYVTIYQECYNEEIYDKVHISGPKKDYQFRYNAPERVLKAGIRGIGMGVLYGLSDPIYESIKLAEHITELRKKYWYRDFSISFPRIKDREVPHPVSDKLFVKIIFLFRLLFPDITLNLSTRETPDFRNKLIGYGINKISAESSTSVGGYSKNRDESGEQFHLYDRRKLQDVVAEIKSRGFQPVFKNYDTVFG